MNNEAEYVYLIYGNDCEGALTLSRTVYSSKESAQDAIDSETMLSSLYPEVYRNSRIIRVRVVKK